MKKVISTVLLLTFLNGCAGMPLVSTLEGSLSINGAIAGLTGKYEHQAANALVNLASHNMTGKTVSEHLYAVVENKYTKKRLEKHFKNKQLSVTNFEIANRSLNDLGILIPKNGFTKNHIPKKTLFVDSKIPWQGFNYRVFDSKQPNFFSN